MSRGVRPRGTAGGGKLSTRQFRQELSDLVGATAEDYGLSLTKATDRGRAFQCWVAELILASEPTFDTEIADVVLAAKDLGADLVAEDSANRLLLICQCKYHWGHDEVSEDEVNDFFHRHDHYLDCAWVAAHGSADAVAALADYRERLEAGWKVEYRFITTARASSRVRELAERCDAAYRAKDAPVRCALYDFGALKDYYLRSRSIEQSIPERVDLDLPVGQWFEKAEPIGPWWR